MRGLWNSANVANAFSYNRVMIKYDVSLLPSSLSVVQCAWTPRLQESLGLTDFDRLSDDTCFPCSLHVFAIFFCRPNSQLLYKHWVACSLRMFVMTYAMERTFRICFVNYVLVTSLLIIVRAMEWNMDSMQYTTGYQLPLKQQWNQAHSTTYIHRLNYNI